MKLISVHRSALLDSIGSEPLLPSWSTDVDPLSVYETAKDYAKARAKAVYDAARAANPFAVQGAGTFSDALHRAEERGARGALGGGFMFAIGLAIVGALGYGYLSLGRRRA